MAKRTWAGLSAGLLLFATGCAQNAITGTAGRHEQIYEGSVGIIGDEHEVIILPGSDVSKLSIIGDENRVTVRDGAVVHKVEIVGEENDVTCPKNMPIEYSEIGEDNQLKHRPAE